MKNERVRYSRRGEKRAPKNTLFTSRSEDGETLYFGIARYNVKLDTFRREVGTFVSSERENRAREELSGNYWTGKYGVSGNLTLHHSGLRGSVPRKNVVELLEYFKSIDAYLLTRLNAEKSEVA